MSINATGLHVDDSVFINSVSSAPALQINSADDSSALKIGDSTGINPHHIVSNRDMVFNAYTLGVSSPIFNFRDNSTKFDNGSYTNLFQIYNDGKVLLSAPGTPAGTQLELAGTVNTGVNASGTKLLISSYDNDDTNYTYPLKMVDENNKTNFYYRSASDGGLNGGQFLFGFVDQGSLLAEYDATEDTYSLYPSANNDGTLGTASYYWKKTYTTEINVASGLTAATANFSSDVTANSFYGNGSYLTDLNASNLTLGVINSALIPSLNSIADDDNDTSIFVEQSVDEDIIRFIADGSESVSINSTGLNVADSIFVKSNSNGSLAPLQINSADDDSSIRFGDSTDNDPHYLVSNRDLLFHGYSASESTPIFQFRAGPTKYDTDNYNSLVSIYKNGEVVLNGQGPENGEHLSLFGATDAGSNMAGTKLLIANYDNDDTNYTYPIKLKDEDNNVDFQFRSASNSTDGGQFTFGFGSRGSALMDYDDSASNYVFYPSTSTAGSLGKNDKRWKSIFGQDVNALTGAFSGNASVGGLFNAVTGDFTGTVTANAFHGDGLYLTDLNASNITSGVLDASVIPSINIISDADNDTKILVEESTDDDIIRFDIAGDERATLTDESLNVSGGIFITSELSNTSAPFQINSVDDASAIKFGHSNGNAPTHIVSNTSTIFNSYTAQSSVPIFYFRSNPTKFDSTSYDDIFQIFNDGRVLLPSPGPQAGIQLELGGSIDTGTNAEGTKLLIRNYDNDDTNYTYPLKLMNEDGGVDFQYRSASLGPNGGQFTFGFSSKGSALFDYTAASNTYSLYPDATGQGSLGTTTNLWGNIHANKLALGTPSNTNFLDLEIGDGSGTNSPYTSMRGIFIRENTDNLFLGMKELPGGSTAQALIGYGDSSNANLVFYNQTSSTLTSRMILDGDGNLDVSSNITAAAFLGDGSGLTNVTATSIPTVNIISDSDGTTSIHTEEFANEDIIRFNIDNTESATLTSTGLGIGTTTPTSLLDLYVPDQSTWSKLTFSRGNDSSFIGFGTNYFNLYLAEDRDMRFYTNTERSEERRVGKECRSRWSPYH